MTVPSVSTEHDLLVSSAFGMILSGQAYWILGALKVSQHVLSKAGFFLNASAALSSLLFHTLNIHVICAVTWHVLNVINLPPFGDLKKTDYISLAVVIGGLFLASFSLATFFFPVALSGIYSTTKSIYFACVCFPSLFVSAYELALQVNPFPN